MGSLSAPAEGGLTPVEGEKDGKGEIGLRQTVQAIVEEGGLEETRRVHRTQEVRQEAVSEDGRERA